MATFATFHFFMFRCFHPEPYSESRRPAEPAEEDIDNKSYHHTICRRLDRMPHQILHQSILVNRIDRYTYIIKRAAVMTTHRANYYYTGQFDCHGFDFSPSFPNERFFVDFWFSRVRSERGRGFFSILFLQYIYTLVLKQ